MNKRLLFGSLGVATAIVLAIGAALASSNDDFAPATDDVILTSGNDLAPSIGTNADLLGRTLAKVDLNTLAGDSLATADLVGRPMVINFWFSTCLPCKKELPAFAEAHAELGNEVRFVGVDTLPPSDSEEQFARDRGVQYELLYDSNGELTSAMGITSFPQTLFVDSRGHVVAQTGELTIDKLVDLIRTQLL